jgi:hypothetical protein
LPHLLECECARTLAQERTASLLSEMQRVSCAETEGMADLFEMHRVVINPDARICRNCGERRRLFRNKSGPCCFRCPHCELDDIMAHLRGEVGAHTAQQFLRNMGASPWQIFMHGARQDYLAECAAEDTVFLWQCGIAP